MVNSRLELNAYEVGPLTQRPQQNEVTFILRFIHISTVSWPLIGTLVSVLGCDLTAQ